MDLIIDANILFAAFITSGKTEELIFRDEFHLFAPEFLFEEFEKYEDIILKKTHRTHEEFQQVMNVLKKRIKILPNEDSIKYLEKAKEVCPDENDVEYFALALNLKCAIWSNDKEIKNQSVVKIFSTKELIDIFE